MSMHNNEHFFKQVATQSKSFKKRLPIAPDQKKKSLNVNLELTILPLQLLNRYDF